MLHSHVEVICYGILYKKHSWPLSTDIQYVITLSFYFITYSVTNVGMFTLDWIIKYTLIMHYGRPNWPLFYRWNNKIYLENNNIRFNNYDYQKYWW